MELISIDDYIMFDRAKKPVKTVTLTCIQS